MQHAAPIRKSQLAAMAAAALLLMAGCDYYDGLKRKAFEVASQYAPVRNTCPPGDKAAAAITAPANVVAASLLTEPTPAVVNIAPAARDAVAAATAYLEARGPRANPLVPVVLSYLSRRFDLDWARGLVAKAKSSADFSRGAAKYYLPLVRADAPAQTLDKKLHVDFVGLYCAEMGFPGEYRDWVKSHTRENKLQEYAGLVGAYLWAVEQGCVAPDDPEWAGLQEHFGRRLAELIAAQRKVTRSYLYAVDMLYYLDQGHRVESDWLDDIRAAQRPDGAWGADDESIEQRDYAAVLALWALHEASGRPRQAVRWSYPVSRPLSMR